MTVFDTASHPTMGVAEAAMASACYPLVFKPRRIKGEAFVDGGLLSNFPAWTLDKERAKLPTVIPTFGFRVVDEFVDEATLWPGDGEPGLIQVVRRIVSAAMWGRGDLESRRIDDLHPMQVKTPIKSTDFHEIMDKRAQLYRAGRTRVADYFSSQLGPSDPVKMEKRLRKICDVVRNITNSAGIVRAYIIQPTDDQFARVVYSAFYEDDADDVLIFRRGSASQTLCLDYREPVLMRVTDLDDSARRASATKIIHAVRPTRVTHVYCIPMFAKSLEWSDSIPLNRSDPVASLCLDFDQQNDALLLDADVEDVLAAIGDALVDLWMERDNSGLERLALQEDQPPSGDWVALPQLGYYVSARKTRKAVAEDIKSLIDSATK